MSSSALEAICRAHDAEEAAQKGEPSPWDIATDAEDFPAFRAERIDAMRAGMLEALPARQALLWLEQLVELADVDPDETFIRAVIRKDGSPEREVAKVSLTDTMDGLRALFAKAEGRE